MMGDCHGGNADASFNVVSGSVTLWTLHRGSGMASCELDSHGSGYTLTVRYRDKPFLREMHSGLTESVTRAAVMREDLEACGWEERQQPD
jgi:hypothetical protein